MVYKNPTRISRILHCTEIQHVLRGNYETANEIEFNKNTTAAANFFGPAPWLPHREKIEMAKKERTIQLQRDIFTN